MKLDKYKFSRQYPAKFNLPGHDLLMMVMQNTIEYPVSAYVSDNKGRLVYFTDHLTHEVVVVVSAAVSGANSVARIISARKQVYRGTQKLLKFP